MAGSGIKQASIRINPENKFRRTMSKIADGIPPPAETLSEEWKDLGCFVPGY